MKRQRMRKRIKDLPYSCRPQEKLLAKGAENLSIAELLAILLGTGTQKQNVLELAKTLLKDNWLTTVLQTQQSVRKGVGKVKTARVVAALELGQRLFGQTSLHLTYVRSPQEMLGLVKELLGKKQEHLVVLYLNARQELIQKETLAIGTLNMVHIEPKELFAPALVHPCASMILIHNHPSGDPSPSTEDMQFTQKMQQAGELLGIILQDHIVLGNTTYFSFAEGKRMNY